MKVVTLLGSPQKNGNSATIAQRIIDKAAASGAECSTYFLHGANFSGCSGCLGCKTGSEKCVLKDGLTEALEGIADADVVILTSPAYFGQVSGQLKCALDRFFSFLTPDFKTSDNPSRLARGKKCVFIATQNNPDPKLFDIFESFERFFEWFGFATYKIRGIGIGPGEIEGRKELLEMADGIAEDIFC